MSSLEPKDTYVILYSERDARWAAIRLGTCQLGLGVHPKEALDYASEALVEPPNPHASRVSYDLLLTLSKTAKPLPESDYKPGVVYTYEWA